MATEKQLKTLDKYVDVIHELLLDQIAGLTSGEPRQIARNRSIFVRMLGQILYEAPKLHTGMCSIRLVEQKLKDFKTKPVLEHHHSRQSGGAAMLRLVDQAIATKTLPTKRQVYELMLRYCQVHYTTAEENAALRKYQRKCSSAAAYRRANIQLIEARDLISKRGRHHERWKQQMRDKYQPIVEQYNNPTYDDIKVEIPQVIH